MAIKFIYIHWEESSLDAIMCNEGGQLSRLRWLNVQINRLLIATKEYSFFCIYNNIQQCKFVKKEESGEVNED